jgi:hypothetical protein
MADPVSHIIKIWIWNMTMGTGLQRSVNAVK